MIPYTGHGMPHRPADLRETPPSRADRRVRRRDQPVSDHPQGRGEPAVVGPWIAEIQAKKAAAQAKIRAVTGRTQMSGDDIVAIVAVLRDLARVVSAADPADKPEIYAQLGPWLTYQQRGDW
jgi:hypothetical protein